MVLGEERDQSEQLRLALLEHGFGRPEAAAVSLWMVQRQRQRDDFDEKVLQERETEARRILNERLPY